MTKRGASADRRRQRGAALLLLMLAVLVAVTAILASRLGAGALRARQLTNAQQTLAHARDELLAYAATYPDVAPGQPALLPCPDLDDTGATLEGEAHTDSCGAPEVTMLGRLPWRTLGMNVAKDSAGACLWYVVSGTHKNAATNTSSLVNPDSNGLLRLYSLESGAVIAGSSPQDRIVAMIIAPMDPVSGQSRPSATASGRHCSNSFSAADFLDADGVSGVSNALVSGAADQFDDFIVAAGWNDTVNDRVVSITQADIASIVADRHDNDDDMRALGMAVAACVANYPSKNAGGSSDRRLPWASPVSKSDYRSDSVYDDQPAAMSGRLANTVDDSSGESANSLDLLITHCDPVDVPAWSAEKLVRWRHLKDHFFYVVSDAYAPNASVPSVCTDCLTVNGSGQYAAVIMFAGARLPSLDQLRNQPPLDADTKGQVDNYLEGRNSSLFPYVGGAADLQSGPSGSAFNDLLFCVDASLNVSEC